MSTKEAAERIGCHQRHVRYLIKVGSLKAELKEDSRGLPYYEVCSKSVNKFIKERD